MYFYIFIDKRFCLFVQTYICTNICLYIYVFIFLPLCFGNCSGLFGAYSMDIYILIFLFIHANIFVCF